MNCFLSHLFFREIRCQKGFRSEVTRWSYLCPDALDHCVECYRFNKPLLDFVPDFTAKVIENSRVLRMKLDDFRACLEGKFDTEYQTVSSPMADTNRSELAQYQYPNTLRLNTFESDSDSEHRTHRQMEHQLTDKIKDIFSKKKRRGKYEAISRRDSHSTDSPRTGPRTSRRMRSEHRERDRGQQYALPSSMDHHQSDPVLMHPVSHRERGPMQRAESDPTERVNAHLPTPSNISDNSRHQSPRTMAPRQHRLSPNPNYRLNENHNLSKVHRPSIDDEHRFDDIANSEQMESMEIIDDDADRRKTENENGDIDGFKGNEDRNEQ